MTETYYVLTALEAPRSTTVTERTKGFSFANIAWPFLPHTPAPSNPTVAPSVLRQRRPGSSGTVSGGTVSGVSTVSGTPLHYSAVLSSALSALVRNLPSWSTLVLLLARAFRTTLARSVSRLLLRSALAVLVLEAVTCLLSLLLAARVPPGLLFMVGAVGLIGFLAATTIGHDSATMRSRRSAFHLLPPPRRS